ncbi:MAG: ribosome maturation factor RimM [Coriobacteriia bacterium]|jgi:16S rRNA processing protein RimM|nr:ribosome maturation factor RimM [Coriobacteriia bacterium]
MGDASFVPVGRIIKVHGLSGELSVAAFGGDDLGFLEGLAVWVVPPVSGPREFLVKSVRYGPKGPLVQLDAITNRADAEAFRGRTLMAHADDLPERWAEEGRDDIGLTVVDVSRGSLGEVIDVIETGANAVWVVEGGTWGQVLIPVIDDVVLQVDDATRHATVRLLPGLIDEQDDQR